MNVALDLLGLAAIVVCIWAIRADARRRRKGGTR